MSALAAAVAAQVDEQDGVAPCQEDPRVLEVGVEGVAQTVGDHDRGLLGTTARQPGAQAQPFGDERRFFVGRAGASHGRDAMAPNHGLGEDERQADEDEPAIERDPQQDACATRRQGAAAAARRP